MQQLTKIEATVLEMVLVAMRRMRDAGLTRAFTVEADVRGRQVEVRVRAHVMGVTVQDEPRGEGGKKFWAVWPETARRAFRTRARNFKKVDMGMKRINLDRRAGGALPPIPLRPPIALGLSPVAAGEWRRVARLMRSRGVGTALDIGALRL